MARSYMITVMEALSYLGSELRHFTGDGDYRDDALICAEIVLDKLFYGNSLRNIATGKADCVEIYLSENHSLRADNLKRMADTFEEMIITTVNRAVRFEPNVYYTYRINVRGDTRITGMDTEPPASPHELIDNYRVQGSGDISDDYIPERMRR